MSEDGRILVVDDELRLRESLKKMLVMDGFSVETAGDGEAGLDALLSGQFDVAIVDLVMPGKDGMWLIEKINEKGIDVGVIVATGYASVELAVKAMKRGAWDFTQKPVEYELLKVAVTRSVEKAHLLKRQKEAEKKIKSQNDELVSANNKLKDLDRLKNNFISKAVHELRSPLTVINCALEIAMGELEDKCFPDLMSHLGHARTFARNMSVIVSEMLDIKLIESAEMKIEMGSGDLAKVVKDTAEGAMPLIRNNALILDVDVPETSQAVFSKNRIMQVIINLMGNAVRHTPEGGRIAVSLKDEGKELVVSVADTGCGIPPESIESIFEEFYQIKRGDEGSTGLGLSICKRIVEAHGGRIWAESEEGVGSTLFFSLPR